jgi:FkbM family methyltransferase
LAGPLKGARWTVGAGNRSFWLGVFEWQKQQAFVRLVAAGDVVFDVGAHAGFYTLLAARLAGPGGSVISFEPDPANLVALRRHIEVNGLANVTVIPAAVSDNGGRGRFRRDSGGHQGHLDPAGDIEVQTVQLDTLWIESAVPPPRLIKIDVEGEEVAVIRGARQLLCECKPVVLVAAHSAALRDECYRELQACGFVPRGLDPYADPNELIAVPREQF